MLRSSGVGVTNHTLLQVDQWKEGVVRNAKKREHRKENIVERGAREKFVVKVFLASLQGLECDGCGVKEMVLFAKAEGVFCDKLIPGGFSEVCETLDPKVGRSVL